MKILKFLLLFLSVGLFSCANTSDNAGPNNTDSEVKELISDTEKAINQLVEDAYASISFEKGSSPDYEHISSHFTPDATFYNFANDSLEFVFINEFIEGFKAIIDEGGIVAFDEVELGGETEFFGKIGHRISAYASYFDEAEEAGQRGVNSFQVIKIDGKWLISSIIWDVEKNEQPIPGKYLHVSTQN